MKKYSALFIVANLIILLAYFNRSVFQKEEILADGQLLLLALVPVDPRSLMQGDYMNLRYAIAEKSNLDTLARRGFCIVRLDSLGVAQKVRMQSSLTPLETGEYAINYTAPENYEILLGAESYFFQEGEGEKYDKAKYGGLKVDKNGNSLLVGLYDENKKKIE